MVQTLTSVRLIFLSTRSSSFFFSAEGISRVLPKFYASIGHVFFSSLLSFIFSLSCVCIFFISSVLSVFYYFSFFHLHQHHSSVKSDGSSKKVCTVDPRLVFPE